MTFPWFRIARGACVFKVHLLRNVAALVTLFAVLAGRADAESQWREYSYPDQQFAATFPAQPEVVRFPADRRVTEVMYAVQQDQERFQVAVFDLLRAGINEATAIASVTASLRENREVKLDIAAEVQGHWGHYLSLEASDGTRIVAAVFFRNERLYEIQASAPASEFDAVSSELVRFQQSVRFTGNLRSRRFAQAPAAGSLENLGGRVFGGSPR